MPCIPLTNGTKRVGFICVPNERIHLMRGVWMEWHSYFGPTFYTTRDGDNEIEDWGDRPKIVAVFEKWQAANPNA